MGAVDPQARRRTADDRGGLRDLILVMGEDVVLAAGVGVEGLAEVLEGHRRALEVPAREAATPARRVPREGAVGPSGLPEREVSRVPLVALDLAPMPGMELVEGVAREHSVAGERRDLVVDVRR